MKPEVAGSNLPGPPSLAAFLSWVSLGLVWGSLAFTWTDVVNHVVLLVAVAMSDPPQAGGTAASGGASWAKTDRPDGKRH